MSTGIIVQARMGSTRLPGKVLKEVMGKPLLGYQLERLQRCRRAEEIIVATTTASADAAIVEFCHSLGVPTYRGSEEDVLHRYYAAAKQFGLKTIVRVTADCPFIAPEVIERVLETFATAEERYDYVSNTLERTFPRGLDCEVFSFDVLSKAFREARQPAEREHVTPYIYTHPEIFRLGNVTAEKDYSDYRWTVDTPEDFELISRLLTALYPKFPQFDMGDVLALMNRHPEWELINKDVEQKPVLL